MDDPHSTVNIGHHPAQQQYSWFNYLVGNYDWQFLCMPRHPFQGTVRLPPFFSKDDNMPLLLAFIMGLQHALAMVGGIIATPLVIAKAANLSPNTEA